MATTGCCNPAELNSLPPPPVLGFRTTNFIAKILQTLRQNIFFALLVRNQVQLCLQIYNSRNFNLKFPENPTPTVHVYSVCIRARRNCFVQQLIAYSQVRSALCTDHHCTCTCNRLCPGMQYMRFDQEQWVSLTRSSFVYS